MTPEEKRQGVVFEALFQETLWAKESPDDHNIRVSRYWLKLGLVEPFPKSWCGALAGYCISSGTGIDLHWKVSQGLFPAPIQIDKRHGQPGDIAWFLRYQHYAIIEEVTEQGYKTVEGNTPGIIRRERTFESIHSVWSIEGMLSR